MALVIDIDGEGLDLFEDTDFYITRQIHDLNSLETRNADYSKQIDVPITAKNTKLLQVDDLFDTADAQPVVDIPCNIILDGISVAINALTFVDKVTDDGYSINILFGNFSFFNNIVGNIDTIDLTEFGFQYDKSGMVGDIEARTGNLTQTSPVFQITFDAPHNLQVGDVFTWRGVLDYYPLVTAVISATIIEDNRVTGGGGVGLGTAYINYDGGIKQETSGVVFALTDWFDLVETSGFDQNSPARVCQDILTSGFFVYTHTLMEKIVTAAGFTLDRSAISTADLYQQTALAAPNPFFVLQESSSTFAVQEANALQIVSGAVDIRAFFPIEIVPPDDSISWEGTPDYQYRWIDVPASITVQSDLIGTSDFGGIRTGTIELMQNAVVVDSQLFNANNDLAFQIVLQASVVANTNDVFYVQITVADARDNITLEITFIKSTIRLGAAGSVPDRTITNPQSFLPEMSRVDFFKGILAMNNIVIQTSGLTEVVTMEYFQGINDKAEQSFTIATDKGATRSSYLSSYFRNNILQYDESDLFRTDTEATFVIEDQRLAIVGTIIQLPFGACDNSLLYDRPPALPVAIIDEYSVEAENVTNVSWAIDTSSVQYEEGFELIVGQYIGIGGGSPWRRVEKVTSISAEVTGIWTYSQQVENPSLLAKLTVSTPSAKIARIVPPQSAYNVADGFNTQLRGNDDLDRYSMQVNRGREALFDDPMLWQNIAADRYAELFDALSKPQLLQLQVVLDVAQFDAIDFLRPVYLGRPYNAQYYINKIDQYKAGKPVRIDLVRISTT